MRLGRNTAGFNAKPWWLDKALLFAVVSGVASTRMRTAEASRDPSVALVALPTADRLVTEDRRRAKPAMNVRRPARRRASSGTCALERWTGDERGKIQEPHVGRYLYLDETQPS